MSDETRTEQSDIDKIVDSFTIKDFEEDKGWEKETIKFIMNNRKTICKMINKYHSARNMHIDLEYYDDEIHKLMLYMLDKEDYNIEKANVEIATGEHKIKSIKSYIFMMYGYMKHYEYNKRVSVDDTNIDIAKGNQNEDEEKQLVDEVLEKMAFKAFENTEKSLDLREVLDRYKHNRYIQGIDIYVILEVSALTQNLPTDIREAIIKVIEHRDINSREVSKRQIRMLNEICASMKDEEEEEVIEAFDEYTNIKEEIEEVIRNLAEQENGN